MPIPWPLMCESWRCMFFLRFALPFCVLWPFWCSCWSTEHFPGLAPDFWHIAVLGSLASWPSVSALFAVLPCLTHCSSLRPFFPSQGGQGCWAACDPHVVFPCRARFIVFWLTDWPKASQSSPFPMTSKLTGGPNSLTRQPQKIFI